jgi:murein L,D-transpeptidase YafK
MATVFLKDVMPMTEENIALYSESKWYEFWINLKEGFDYFEAEHLPPQVKVENNHYNMHESDDSSSMLIY